MEYVHSHRRQNISAPSHLADKLERDTERNILRSIHRHAFEGENEHSLHWQYRSIQFLIH